MTLTNLVTALEIAASLTGQPDTTALAQQSQVQEAKAKTEVVASEQKPAVMKSNIEYHMTGDPKTSKGRLNLFYGLPGQTKVYTFVELYPENGYFMRTMASTPINTHKTNLQVEMKNSNSFQDRAAIGLSQGFNAGPLYGSMKVLPAWFTKEGYVPKAASVGGLAGITVPIGKKDVKVDISAFGEVNVQKKQWAYGEAEAKLLIPTKAGQIDIGGGYNFNGVGKFVPDGQFRVKLGYHPKL